MYTYRERESQKDKKTDNVPSRLLPVHQWPHDSSCTWAHDVRLHIVGTSEPKSAQHVKQGAL